MNAISAVAAVALLVIPTVADAAPRFTRAKSDSTHQHDFVVKKKVAAVAFPKTKTSDSEGVREEAKLAYFTCRGGYVAARSPEAAQKKCEQGSRKRAKDGFAKERCRCTGAHAIAVYGPYPYKEAKKRGESNDYPYEGTDGQSYTRNGEGLMP